MFICKLQSQTMKENKFYVIESGRIIVLQRNKLSWLIQILYSYFLGCELALM